MQDIKNLYEGGTSTAKIAEKYNSNGESVRLILKKMGVKVRSRKEACSKYDLDESFFDKIDNEVKAYWLGFLTADGGVVNHQIILSLSSKDEVHISKFLVESPTFMVGEVQRVRHGSREDIFNISSLLYANSTVYLDRKFAIAKSIYENPYFKLRKNSKIKQTCEQAN